MDHLFADMLYHWNAGKHLFNPSVMDAINPKFYQLYMAILREVSGDNRYVIALVTGGLCASLPWLWYKACREFMDKWQALVTAVLIAGCPTLWTVYGYFMNETLLLNMMALATWMSLRAGRKRTGWAVAVAVICWVLAVHTRRATGTGQRT